MKIAYLVTLALAAPLPSLDARQVTPPPRSLGQAQGWVDAPREVIEELGLDEYGRFAAAGDIDGDGREDLIVVVSTGFLVVLAGPGDGFRALPLNAFPTSSVFGLDDVTGDGKPDFVFSRGSTICVAVNTGGGTLADPVSATAPTISEVVGVLADREGDGIFDIATTYYDLHLSRSVAQWWKWDQGAIVPEAQGVSPQRTYGVSAAEVTGDGLVDIVGAALADVIVSETIAGGSATGVAFSIPGMDGIRQPSGADLDGDGDDDLLVSFQEIGQNNMKLQVVENLGAGQLALGSTTTIVELSGCTNACYRRALADWDGDGDLDFFIAGTEDLHSFENVNGSRYELAASANIFRVFFTLNPNRVCVADLNGDGYPDVAAGKVVKYGNRRFEDLTKQLVRGGVTFRAADVDGDSAPDLFANGNHVGVNDGRGKLEWLRIAERIRPAPTSDFQDSKLNAVGDFDGDGLLDVIVRLDTQPVTHILAKGSGNGFFRERGEVVPSGASIGGPVTLESAPVDFDGDGDLDIVPFEQEGWWANDGSAAFVLQPAWVGQARAVADVDGDGDWDVAVLRNSDDVYDLKRNNGDGTFATSVLGNDVSSLADKVTGLFADVDRDGDPDFVYRRDPGSSPVIRVVENAAGSFSGTPVDVAIESYSSAHIVFDDVDGDRVPDMISTVAKGMEADLAYAWRGKKGAIAFHPPRVFRAFPTTAAADLDMDGDLDLFRRQVLHGWRRNQSGHGWVRGVLGPPAATSGNGLAILRGSVTSASRRSVELSIENAPVGAPGVVYFEAGPFRIALPMAGMGATREMSVPLLRAFSSSLLVHVEFRDPSVRATNGLELRLER